MASRGPNELNEMAQMEKDIEEKRLELARKLDYILNLLDLPKGTDIKDIYKYDEDFPIRRELCSRAVVFLLLLQKTKEEKLKT